MIDIARQASYALHPCYSYDTFCSHYKQHKEKVSNKYPMRHKLTDLEIKMNEMCRKLTKIASAPAHNIFKLILL